MSSVFLKRGSYWASIKGDKQPGKWSCVPTHETDRDAAIRFATAAQKAIDKRRGVRAPDSVSLRDWCKGWIDRRRESENDWKKDRGRLDNHILPALGGHDLTDITTALVADLVHALRFKAKLAARTVRNIYSVLAAVLRDAAIAGKIPLSPCTLTEVQLGPLIDKDPEWRTGALFTRKEAEAMISDRRIPLDRQVVYGFGLLAGLRPGEGAALRWRHYDVTSTPLGKLTVAHSYSTSYSATKRTKTLSVRHVPVHPALATLLEHWRLGWAEMHGRPAEPDDLIVPLPPAVRRTKRKGERFRGWDYTGKRWRDIDLKALGWRARSVYDTKSTFITLAIEDGADPTIIKERVTHTRARRDAFDGYDRGPHWIATCREVAKLAIRRFSTDLLPGEIMSKESTTKGLRRRVSNVQSAPPELHVIQGGREVMPTSCDLGMIMLVESFRPGKAEAEPTPTQSSGGV